MQETKPLGSLIEIIKNHVQQLLKINDEVIKKLSHYDYPIKLIISFYQKEFLPKISARLGKSDIFSDVVILFGHKFVGFVYAVEKYVDSLDVKAKKESIQLNGNSPGMQRTSTLPNISMSTRASSLSNQTSLTDITFQGNLDNN